MTVDLELCHATALEGEVVPAATVPEEGCPDTERVGTVAMDPEAELDQFKQGARGMFELLRDGGGPRFVDPNIATPEPVRTSELPLDRWADHIFQKVRDEWAARRAEEEARRLARIPLHYCMLCGYYDKLPDGIMDRYCIDNPPQQRSDGLPRWFLNGPTIL